MKIIKSKIREITKVSLGHTFRKGVNVSFTGTTRLIQVKDITENGDLLGKQLDAIDYKFNRDIELVSKGDIVFCPREHKLIAVLIKEDLGAVVVSAPLILLRVIDRSKISPSFLQAYLNSPQVINQLKNLLMGSFIQTINKADFMEFEVIIPSLAKLEQQMLEYR